jgi:hypothetical protein
MRELEKIRAPTGCPHIPQLATTTPGATIESNQQRGTPLTEEPPLRRTH